MFRQVGKLSLNTAFLAGQQGKKNKVELPKKSIYKTMERKRRHPGL